MGDEAAATPPAERPPATLNGVVPKRAVLTELARGFLLVHDSDPSRARRFAETFLKERAGSSVSARLPTYPRVPSVHRGIRDALRER
jgi:hypothetical protein